MKETALVFIPARNEAEAIGAVVRGCRAAGFAVMVIDDASSDATASLARRAGAEVLSPRGPHHGKTAALRHALLAAPAGFDWFFFLDGDGQHDPADLARFWAARHDADLVVGNRMPDAARMPLLRRWTNRVMSAVLRRSGIADSQCGFRLVRRGWLGAWLPAGHHFQFESEMALLAASRPARVVNLPIAATYAREESKIVPMRDAANFARCLWQSSRGPGCLLPGRAQRAGSDAFPEAHSLAVAPPFTTARDAATFPNT
ncbi:MAG TPA: glycosyltransferase family 2 protein [Candidatus Methylacidiphilales bacterium]|nr:glycosyltransferase family 2 protein [Candidatus Methylacidiphilales bacterium]